MITKKKCASDEEWRALRLKTIGGSDAAALLGLSQYTSPYSLWCEKTGKIVKPDISDREAVRLGNDLEQYVAERFMEATGKKVRRENHVLYNTDLPFAHASVDRMVIGESAGLECKTSSSWEVAKQLKAGEIPDYWYCQCTHYMMVTGANTWYLAALVFGSGFYYFTIERNEEEITALMLAEHEFYKLMTTDVPPALDGSDATAEAIGEVYGDSTPGSYIDLSAVGDHIEAYNAIGAQIKELETLQAEHANAIKEYMCDAEKGSYDSTTITWKSSARKTFDKKRYEKAHGAIPEEFYNTSESRSFRVTVKEK